MFAKTQLLALVLLAAQVTAQEPAPWWARISAEDTTGILEMCFKKTAAGVVPNTGDKCSRFAKICFFGVQECPGVGPHPTERCECDGLFAPGATRTWTCAPEACPTGVETTTTAAPPETTTAATEATTVATEATTAATDAASIEATTAATEATTAATEATTAATEATTAATEATTAATEATTAATEETTAATEATTAATDAANGEVTTVATEETTAATEETTAATEATTAATEATTAATEATTAATEATTAATEATTPGPCPAAIPSTGQSDGCTVNGRTCTYVSEASNATTLCKETDVCTCGIPSWACEPTVVECEELPPVDCPAAIPTASDSCERADITCTYTETVTNDTDVCEVITPCTCDGSGYTCDAPAVTCTERPERTCPPTPPLTGDMSCPESGFTCTYTSGSANDTSICNTTNTCTCGDDLMFGCADPVVNCVDAPDFTCPDAPDDGGSCTAPGRSCDYTINNQNETFTCTVNLNCACSDDGIFICGAPTEDCVPSTLPTCPEGTIATDDACEAPGLVCTAVTVSSNATNTCNTTNACTCGTDNLFDCAVDVTCIDLEPAVCPDAKPITGDTCGGNVGCAYSNTFSNSTDLCSIDETCTCTDNVFTCAEPTIACQPAPVCSAAPDPGGACPVNGLQCTFVIPSANETASCVTTTVCTCDGTSYSCEDTDVSCDPADYSCPLSRPAEGEACVGGAGEACTFAGTLRNDTSTCDIVNTCTCSAGETFSCVETSVSCTDSAPLTCPQTLPSSGDVACGTENLACTYQFTSATEPGCVDETVCVCGDAVFTCGLSQVVCPT